MGGSGRGGGRIGEPVAGGGGESCRKEPAGAGWWASWDPGCVVGLVLAGF